MYEIRNGVDQHTDNQKRFGLPERRIAKIFVFRLIYGGSAWAYTFDSDFNFISKNHKYWQKVIDAFYEKYGGIAKQHTRWMQEAMDTGGLIMPTGRQFDFKPYLKNGEMKWPRTTIVNYPVQSTGADIVAIFRVSLYNRLAKLPYRDRIKLRSTVHDSVVLDTEAIYLRPIADIVISCFNDLPANFERLFDTEFNLPLKGEISYGQNLRDMEKLV